MWVRIQYMCMHRLNWFIQHETCLTHPNGGINSKSKDFEDVGSVTSSFLTFQGKIKVINSVSRVIIGQWNIKISKESNCHFFPRHFPHFHVVIYICMEKKPALDNWKIVARASLFKLVWKGAKSRLWSFVWSWLVMFWRFWRESLF